MQLDMAAAGQGRGPRVTVVGPDGNLFSRHFKTSNALYAQLDKVLGTDADRVVYDCRRARVLRDDDDLSDALEDIDHVYLSVDLIRAWRLSPLRLQSAPAVSHTCPSLHALPRVLCCRTCLMV